ncbi:MAG: translation elongation factor-like protein [Patescibacteria group bacterium]
MGFFSFGKSKTPKPIGLVTHYYGGLSVAIVKFNKTAKVGDKIHFKGATTDFEEKIKSMQYDHKDVTEAKKNQEIGIKVGDKAREGDEVYAVE